MNKSSLIILPRRLWTVRYGNFSPARAASSKPNNPSAYLDGKPNGPDGEQWSVSNRFPKEARAGNPLQRMPTSSLIRNWIIGTSFTSPLLVKLAMPLMDRIANSQSLLTHPERNPVVRFFVKQLVYDQFCAGVNENEISKTRQAIKGQGYAGIILCPGREVQVSKDNTLRSTGSGDFDNEIRQWKEGALETVDMIGEGDWIGIKMTGAGTKVTQAMMRNDENPPEEFHDAMKMVCERAKAKNCRVWIDAEQQVLQGAIDRWTIDLMRRFNNSSSSSNGKNNNDDNNKDDTHQPGGTAVVYNTVQAYLKESRAKLARQLALADGEGWTLGIKLVRGAYMANDQRDKIHDCKADTDASYDGIVADLLRGTNLGFSGPDAFPRMQLFIAGHNPHSVRAAAGLVATLAAQGRLKVLPDFGQLQGMADRLGCELLEHCEEEERAKASIEGPGAGTGTEKGQAMAVVPRVYKCLTWGSVQECIQYLFRRMVENKGGSDRLRDGLSAYSEELRRRLFRAVFPFR